MQNFAASIENLGTSVEATLFIASAALHYCRRTDKPFKVIVALPQAGISMYLPTHQDQEAVSKEMFLVVVTYWL